MNILIFRSINSTLSSWVLVFDPVCSVLAAAGVSPLSSCTVIWQRRLKPEWGLKAYRKLESNLLILLSHLLCLKRQSFLLSLCPSNSFPFSWVLYVITILRYQSFSIFCFLILHIALFTVLYVFKSSSFFKKIIIPFICHICTHDHISLKIRSIFSKCI